MDAIESMKDPKMVKRLFQAVEASNRALEPFRRFRKEVFVEMAGSQYGQGSAARQATHLNKIEHGMTTFSRLLTARYPKVRVKTTNYDLKATALTFQAALDRDLQELRFRDTMQAITMDALALFGVAKCGLNGSGMGLEIEGVTYDPMQPYFQRVSPDNFVMDMSARDWDTMQFVGDLVRRDYDWMVQSGLYDMEGINPDSAGTKDAEKGADTISRPSSVDTDTLYDRVSFWEIYIPRDHMIVCLSRDGGKVLRAYQFDGPEFGPYEMLSFVTVPDNIVPLSPAMGWMDMHKLIANMMRKFSAQAKRQKSILAVLKRAIADGKKIQTSSDGEIITVDSKGAAEEISFGGIDQKNWAFLIWCSQQFNMMAGNLEVLNGLSAQSGTVGQDQLLSQNANMKVDDMRHQVVEFSGRNIEKLAWYHYTDPIRTTAVSHKFPDLPFEIPVLFTPEMREADFNEFGFQIEPYSMLPRSPSQDRAELMELLAQIIMPMAPMFAEQGKVLDAAGLIDMLGEYGNIKELDRLFAQAQQNPAQPGQPGAGQGQGGGMPQHTVRENVRKNVSAGTNRGNDQQLMMSLLGAAGNGMPMMSA